MASETEMVRVWRIEGPCVHPDADYVLTDNETEPATCSAPST